MRGIQLSALCLAVLLALPTAAQTPRPVREARSENARFLLQINPGRPGRGGRNCEAVLYEREARGETNRRVWEHALVNETAPMLALIRDDGRIVVTLDEYHRGGARNAIVVYGPQGELLRHFLLTDLLGKDDWPHVQVSRREVIWLKDARCAFDDPTGQLVVKLSWGREIRVDLKTLQVVRAAGASDAGAGGPVPAEIMAQLCDHTSADEEHATPARLGGLSELTPDEQAQTEAIAQQLSPTPETPTTQVAEPPPAPPAEVAKLPAEAVTPPPQAAKPAVEPTPPAEPAPAVATGIVVPPPDAAKKVDYVAWLNRLGQVDGPDARPLYEAACAQLTPFPDNPDLLAAAVRGDAAALAAREVTNWLQENADALAKFRQAAQCPARGWSFHSEDGSALTIALPDLTPLRTLARAIVVEGRRLASVGQGPEAARRYFDVLAAGAQTGGGLTLVENLVGTAMQAPAADALLDLEAEPAAGTLDYAALSRAAEAAYRPTRSAAEAVQGERAFLMDAVQRTWDVDPQTGQYTLNNEKAKRLLTLVAGQDVAPAQQTQELARLADIGYEQTVALAGAYYDAVETALALPYPQAVARLAEIDQALGGEQDAHPFLSHLTPSLTRYALLKARGETNRRAALLVTNLQAYRQEHGAYPASLDAFADRDFADDPFAGTPFVYRRVGDSFVLYSVGANGVDDAGVHDRKGETNDLVFWPRPK